MDGLLAFFQGIGDTISSVVSFVISFFEDVVYIVQLTGKMLAQIPSYFSWIPAEFLALIITIFSIIVIYKITGREG